MKAKEYIKLGTALRYLIDVQEGEPLGGKHILQNINTTFNLISDLEFVLTLNSAGVTQLKNLYDQLQSVSTTVTTISNDQAKELERVCRKIRESLMTEAEGMELLKQGNETNTGSLAPPEKVTLKWLFTHVPVPLWFAFIGLLSATYVVGVQTSKIEIVRQIFELDSISTTKNEKQQTVQPNNPLHKDASR